MWNYIEVVAIFSFKEALGSKLFSLLALLLVLALGLGEFLGSVAITETDPIRAALLGSFLRLYTVVAITLFASSSIANEWHDKGVQLVIALPYPRAAYFFGRWFGFLAVGTFTAIVVSTLLLFYVPYYAVAAWVISLICELAIVLTFTLVVAMTWHQSPTITLSVLAFYTLARSIAAIQLIGHGPLNEHTSASQQVISKVIDGLAYVLPELHRYTLTEWLVYPETIQWQGLIPIFLQSGIYVALLCVLGLFDLYRKEF